MNSQPVDIEPLRESFHRDGFVTLRGFLSGEELAELLANLGRYIREVVPTLTDGVFYEDKARPETLKQMQDLHERDDYFEKLFYGSKFEALAGGLLGGPVVGKNLQYFDKPPGVGRATPAHQDGYYFMIEPCEAITMWVALEQVDEENGCVRYVRGSHVKGVRDHARTQTLGFSQSIIDYGRVEDLAAEVAVPAQAGDLLAHHALTIHRADGNHSATRTRKALGFVYYAAEAKQDISAHAAYHAKLMAELKESGKI